MVAVPRVRAAQVVLEAATTPAQLAAVQAAASKHSLMAFQCFAQTLKEDNAKDPDQPILGECASVCVLPAGLPVCCMCCASLLLSRPHSQHASHTCCAQLLTAPAAAGLVSLLQASGRRQWG